MTDVTIRQALASDVAAMHRLLAALALHTGAVNRGSEAALLRYGFGARPMFHAVLAEQGGGALGLSLFYPDFSTLRGRPGVYVQDLVVEDAARGHGLGRRLLERTMHLARQDWQADYMVLMVDRGNDIARGFYSRLGFREGEGYRPLVLEGSALEILCGR